MKSIIIVNSKCYPIDDDGGTCFTTYEVAKSAELHGFKAGVLIPRIFGRETKEYDGSLISQKGLIKFCSFLYKKLRSKNIIYYNCGYNPHIILTLFIAYLCKINHQLNATILFSGHGSFDHILSSGILKKIWISLIIIPFMRLTKCTYILNSDGEYDAIYPDIKALDGIKFYTAQNAFPSFTFMHDAEETKSIIDNSHEPYFDFRYVLYLGRIVRKKRLMETIKFLDMNEWFQKGGKLLIAHVNDDEKYLEEIRSYLDTCDFKENIVFMGKVHGAKKWSLILNACAFILLSISEGLPMAILEADYLGIPVILTKECNYIPETEKSIICTDITEKDYNGHLSEIYERKLDPSSIFEEIDNASFHASKGFLSTYYDIFNEIK